jgi:hypothetical protein
VLLFPNAPLLAAGTTLSSPRESDIIEIQLKVKIKLKFFLFRVGKLDDDFIASLDKEPK